MNKLIYIVVAITVFLIFIIAMAPASLLTSAFGDELQHEVPGLKLGTATGRIWQGTVPVQYRQFPPTEVSWDVMVLPLVSGKVHSLIELSSDGLQLTLAATAYSSGGVLDNIEGSINSRFINAVSVDYGLDLSGDIEITGAQATFSQNSSNQNSGNQRSGKLWLTALLGDLAWSGGIIHIETPEQFYSVKLPALSGQLSLDDRDATLVIASDSSPLLTLALSPDGWSRTSISYRLMDMAGLPVPNDYQDTTGAAFVLEEQVF